MTKFMSMTTCILVGLFIFLICVPLQAADESLTLSTVEGVRNVDISKKVVIEAYGRIGIKVSIIKYPGLRALNRSNSGVTDGELYRVAGISTKYPNLIRVPVAINRLDGMVFTKNFKLEVKGWDSLKSYKIGVRRGIIFSSQGTSGMNTYVSDTYDDLLKILDKGRVDIAIFGRVSGLGLLQRSNLKGIRLVEPPIQSYPMYHYLHKKKSHLIPKITVVLQEMEEKGLIQEIRQGFILEHFGTTKE